MNPQLDLSQGQTLTGAPQPVQQGAPSAPPALDMSQSQGTNVSNTTANPAAAVHNDELQWSDSSTLGGVAKNILKTPAMALEGAGEGVFSTLGGFASAVNKGAQFVHDKTHDQQLHELVQGHRDQVHVVPQGAVDKLHDLAGDNNTKGSSTWANMTGYGGETLAEFMSGDEALKTLSMADKALATAKSLKVLEKTPKLFHALKAGAAALAEQSARAGVVQGAQTLVRSGGDIDAASHAAVEGAATTGVLGTVAGGVGTVASKLAGKLGEGGEAAGRLAEQAANASDNQGVTQDIQAGLQKSQNDLHTNYEDGIQDLEGRLQGTTIDPKTSPIASKAEEILQKPNPEDHPSVAQLKEIRGEKLDPKVRQFLEDTANGKAPLTDEDVEAAETANANKPKIIDPATNKPYETADVEPEGADLPPHDAHSLIQWRQQVRALAADQEPGSVSARALNRLLFDASDHSSAFDDTFSDLANASNDPTAVSDYQGLRADYRSKIGIYDTPVIKNLMDGKADDAAKAFIGTKSASGLPAAGKTVFNVDQLRTVLGENGFNHFRDQVFGNMLKNASDPGGGFNPAKFMSTWGKVSDGTKGDFFNTGSPKAAPQTFINSMLSDAKTAASVQKLTRAGLIAGPGSLVSLLHPAVGGIATVLAFIAGHDGAGGIAKGRDMLDYIANNPRTWAIFRKIGNSVGGPASQAAKAVVPKMGQAAVSLNSASDEDDKQKDALAQASKVYKSLGPTMTAPPAGAAPTAPQQTAPPPGQLQATANPM